MIGATFTRIEKRLYDSLKMRSSSSCSDWSKSLVFTSPLVLKGNEVTMEKVLRSRVLKLYEDDRDILGGRADPGPSDHRDGEYLFNIMAGLRWMLMLPLFPTI